MHTFKKYYVFLSLGIMIVFGFFLRSADINFDSLWIDEGFTLSQANAIRTHSYPLLPSGKTEWKDPLLPYLLALIPGKIQENIAIFRMISVVFGTASILLIYMVGKNFFGSSIGLISSFFLTFSYWHIAWSRQIRSYSLLVFLLLGTVFFLSVYHKTKEKKFLLAMIFFLILSILAKTSGILLIPGILFFLIRDKKILSGAAIALVGILLAIFIYGSFLNEGIGFSSVHYGTYYLLEYFWKEFGIMLVLALLGSYLVWREKDFRTNMLFISLFIIPFIFFSFFVYIGQKRYLFFVTPILFLYAAYFIHAFKDFFVRKHLIVFSLLLSVVLIDQFTARSLLFFPRSHFALETYTPQPNFRGVFAALQEDTRNKNAIVISTYPFMDQIYFRNADYAIALSYTGKSSDLSMTEDHREYYSGTPEIRSISQIRKMNETQTIYVIVDEMALSRMNSSMAKFIQQDMSILFIKDDTAPGSAISMYKADINTLSSDRP